MFMLVIHTIHQQFAPNRAKNTVNIQIFAMDVRKEKRAKAKTASSICFCSKVL